MPGTIARTLLSLVVPPLCLACREPELSGAPVCDACARAMQAIRPSCRRCGAPVPCAVDACVECRGRALAFDRAWAPFAYTGAARELVLGLKARDFGAGANHMAGAIWRRAPPGLIDGVLVPAPAHRERLWRHGENQAQALAAALGRLSGLPVRPVLARRTGGRRQVGLERHARRANARGWIHPTAGWPPGTPAVLVDDVYTTGATLDACATALRALGAGPVTAVCFARTVRASNPLVSVAQRPGAA